MSAVKIIGIETANPPLRVTQEEVWENIMRHRSLSNREMLYYKTFLHDPNIQTRHVGIDDLKTIYTETPDDLIGRFERFATATGTEATQKCLRARGVLPMEVDALFVTTCTGYLCPGLSSLVARRVGFKSSISTLDLVGQGCGAAIPALRAARDYLMAHPDANVLVLCVEICTAAISWGEDVELILSNAIFADGAAACLLTNREESSGIVLSKFHSILWPEFRDHLRFRNNEARLCNVIKKEVPGIAGRAVRESIDGLLGHADGGIDHYAVHPGGRKILDAIESSLNLPQQALRRSREVLRDYGNMSSPSVLFVLKKMLEEGDAREGDTIALFAFGAGFSAFGLLARYEQGFLCHPTRYKEDCYAAGI